MDNPEASSSGTNKVPGFDFSRLSVSSVVTCKCAKCTEIGKKRWLEPPLPEFLHIVSHNMPEYLPVVLMHLQAKGATIISCDPK